MKKWLVLFVFWSTTVFAGGNITVHVEGMTCPMCAGKAERELKTNSEIKEIDIDTGVVEITLKSSKQLSDQKIKEAISKAGYKTKKITR